MANFETKTIKQIYDGIIAKYTTLRNKYGDTAPLLEKAAVRSIAYAFAGVAGILWQLSTWIYKQCFPQTAELDNLKYWGNLVGVDYKNGETASLKIILSNVTASALPAGTIYKHLKSGLIFKTISAVNTENGTIIATAQCTTSGEVGNLTPGEELNIANPYDGIPSTATIQDIAVKGTEDEKTEDYRKRVLYKFRSRSQGGAALDYYNWCLEVPGIVDALPYVINEGEVDIYLIGQGSGKKRTPTGNITPNPFPMWQNGTFEDYTGQGVFLNVANSIEGSEPGLHDRRPMCAKVKLLPPIYKGYSIEITGLTSNVYNEQVKNAIIANLDFKRPHIKVLGYGVSRAKINALSLAADVSSVIGDETFTGFTLKNPINETVTEEILGVGCLPFLANLKINGSVIPLP